MRVRMHLMIKAVMIDMDRMRKRLWRMAVFGMCLGGVSGLGLAEEGPVIFNEIHSDPVVKTHRTEFVELYNRSASRIELSGWGLRGGIDYAFPGGSAIEAGGYVIVGPHPEDLDRHFDVDAVGPVEGRIANEGEDIELRDPDGSQIDEVDYGLGFPWPTVGDPPAKSMELVHPGFDNDLGGSWRSSKTGPTPGRKNSVFAGELPPRLTDVTHSPRRPKAGESVRVTVRAIDPDGVADVSLGYQLVEPGAYFSKEDPEFEERWTWIAMSDDGEGADPRADDAVYTAELSGSLQQHRNLIRYRIRAEDSTGMGLMVPYTDDPQPNFAYFVYDGVPPWEGAIDPDSQDTRKSEVVQYGTDVMRSLPVYHLLTDNEDVMECQFLEEYRGSDYKWEGTLVYNGEVYDHVHYRARGGVWRYAMGKNMWKFDFNRGHHFQARDDYGREYDTVWDKLNLSAIIQQGNFGYRGEQGMFEAVGFELFNRVGVEGPLTHWTQFRVIDDAAEQGATQYDGDLWGMYLVVEQPDGRLLDEHKLPDGNFYKMESWTGEKNNQGPTAPADQSDLNRFLSTYRNDNPSEQWWREHLDLERYYSYRAIVEAIHHYDIGNGKNYFYYHNPETGVWSVHPWDLDLTWADSMFGDGNEPFKERVLAQPVFNREYQNRLREIRDLLFNTDQALELIDEHAAVIDDPGGEGSMVDVDRRMWDYNPIMTSGYVNPNKAGEGRFYESGFTRTFRGLVQKMRVYVETRAGWIDENLLEESKIPKTPEIRHVAQGDEITANNLTFRCSELQDDSAGFGAMEWRLAEVTPENAPAFDRDNPHHYEINSDWESGELGTFAPEMTIPAGVCEVGHTYRVRARMKDDDGWWSHWSEPVEFNLAQAPDAETVSESIRVSELMYHPTDDNGLEFIELENTGSGTVDLSGVTFTDGIDFSFPIGSSVAPGERFLVVNADPAEDFQAFRDQYGLEDEVSIWGPYDGRFDNGGERVALRSAPNGELIAEFGYSDDRGWPLPPDGGGHSLVPKQGMEIDQTSGGLSYGRNWRISTFLNGSPGEHDPDPSRTVMINELLAHTDFDNPSFPNRDSNDWIELYNAGDSEVNLQGWFLSDSLADLQKWAIPNVTLASGSFVTFDEVTGFHPSLDSGFGLDKAGEQLFLSHFPGGGQDRVADSVRFAGQVNGMSLGRYPDGGRFWYPLEPSTEAPNESRSSIWDGVVISEVMYHPDRTLPSATSDQAAEFLELSNTRDQPLELGNAEGTWRLRGGVEYTFGDGITLRENEAILVVGFDPGDTLLLSEFREAYSIPESVKVVGPYQGRLSNNGEHFRLERPQAPDVQGGSVSWVIVDELAYSDQSPWPSEADGNGGSLQRRMSDGPELARGNDPTNWESAEPSPGTVRETPEDSDGDGMPDSWEEENGLDPDLALDAERDADGDGQSNLAEYFAGTDPQDRESHLRIESVRILEGEGLVEIRFEAKAERAYELQASSSLGTDTNWSSVATIPSGSTTEIKGVTDDFGPTEEARFYRIRVDREEVR